MLITCERIQEEIPLEKKGGVVITFDDNYVSQWFKADSVLNSYNWKATFCVAYYDNINVDNKQKLKLLQDSGHEIAGHGLNHVNIIDFLVDNSIEDYVDQEILPMLELMEKDSLEVTSFAYPYGWRSESTDSIMLEYFNIVRGVEWGGDHPIADHDCFFNNSPLVFGFGIDSNFDYFSEHYYEQYILDLLTYARDNNKLLVLLGHETVEVISRDYQVAFSILKSICQFIDDNEMEFYTLSELKTLINTAE